MSQRWDAPPPGTHPCYVVETWHWRRGTRWYARCEACPWRSRTVTSAAAANEWGHVHTAMVEAREMGGADDGASDSV